MEPRPQQTQSILGFDPEVDPICPETCESALPGRCLKAASNHPLYVPFNELDRQHLPAEWRHQDTLQRIRDIGQRVVKLRVRKLSSDRPVDDPRLRKYGHVGTGFVTYDADQGVPVVNTNRHVVHDSYEASHTEVVFFYEGDSEGIQCAGSNDGFRCPIGAMDSCLFRMQQPLPEAVITWQNGPVSSCQSENQGRTKEAAARKSEKLDEAFSWPNISDISGNVVIISHPHGSRKQMSVGKLDEERHWIFAHSVPTCPGSSGAPLLTLGRMDERPLLGRLDGLDTADVHAGRITHQGANPSAQDKVLGVAAPTVRITLPYDELGGQVRRLVKSASNNVYYKQFARTNNEEPVALSWRGDRFIAFPIVFGLFCIVGPPWTLAALACMLYFASCGVILYGAFTLRFGVFMALYLSIDLAAIHGVTQLAYVLVLPDDRGWLWTALLALSYFLITLVTGSNPVRNLLFESLAKHPPRAMIQIEDWLGRWAETLLHKLCPYLLVPRVSCMALFCDFLFVYGLFCVVGPPWTLAAFLVFLTIIIIETANHNPGDLRRVVGHVLYLAVRLAAMHGVTELAYVLMTPDDRGGLWRPLPMLLLSHLVIDVCLARLLNVYMEE